MVIGAERAIWLAAKGRRVRRGARVALQLPPLPVLPIAFGGTALVIVAAMGLDGVTLRRLHPAMLWGGLIVILSLPGRLLIASTQAWQDLAAWLIA